MYLFGEMTSWPLFGLGIAMLVFILLRRTTRYYSGKGKRRNLNANDFLSVKQPRKETPLMDAPPEILCWQVEMHETARDLKAELDSKMSGLQSLVAMARQEAERLEAIIARATELGLSANTDPLQQIERLASESPDDLDKRLCLISGPFDRSSCKLPGTKDQRSEIYTLADLGKPPAAIANLVGASLGDVEMILGSRGCE